MSINSDQFESWGRYPKVKPLGAVSPNGIEEVQPAMDEVSGTVLARGKGRSYGDCCLNENGYLILTRGLDRIEDFDESDGVLRCESGVGLDEILRRFVPLGWFLPVTPGTKFVTIGGAIANDIHGKNHHVTGSFGNHVRRFELLRSDGVRIVCSPTENTDWFRATIGGLGLTGFILWAEIELKPIPGPYIDVTSIKISNLDEFASISRDVSREFEYTVAWIDCIARGKQLGRGVYLCGNHADKVEPNPNRIVHQSAAWKNIPFDFPSFALCTSTVRLFNFLYYHKQLRKRVNLVQHYDPFFYPLDGIRNWNRMYGKRGFMQWQCVVPFAGGYDCIREVLTRIAHSKLASFLVVIKEFGDTPNAGMLSFPMPGITLSLDFANVGPRILRLLEQLDQLVLQARGRIYPAKDARMSADTFAGSFTTLADFENFVDPKFSSSLYRRVTAGKELRHQRAV